MKHFRMLAAGLCSAVLLCGFAIPAYAYSDGGNEEPPVVEETPAPEPAPTITPGEGFSEDGNLVTRDLLYDAATNKQFITVETSGGNTFYIVIDYDKPVDEDGEQYHTYFLNMVDEADLLAAMELAGQNIEDEEIRTLMKMQKKGLGTDATRAPILKGLFDRHYLERKGKTIFPTDKGMFLIDALPVAAVKSADMTGNWEMRLNNIALGKENPAQFIADISQTTRDWFAAVAGAPEHHFGTAAQLEFSCPHCGKPLTRLATVCKCSTYSKDENACHFHMSTYICGQRLSDDTIQTLLNRGRSGLIKGFKAKTGKKFNAYLVLNRETGEITFDFSSEAEKKLQCPFCHSSMEKSRYSYLCTNAECGFKAPAEICKKRLTAAQVTLLLTKGRTGVIKGFKSKVGKPFSAALYIDQSDRTVKFDFQKNT